MSARSPAPADVLAEVLAGSWRPEPPRLLRSSALDLARVLPLLAGSGAAALAWWKLRRSGLRESEPCELLRRHYRTQALQSALQEREVEYVFKQLRAARVEPVLLKGLAAASLYPERALRPPGDIDLCVRPEQYGAAAAAVWARGREGRALVDLRHDEFALLGAGGLEGLYERSRLVTLNESEIRVLGREDLLRFLCIHLLRHSGYRPVWLCDVAAAFESAPPGFDWEVALGDDPLKRNWVGCVLDLARRLLGARNGHAPREVRAARAPDWLVREVLRQWESPCTAEHLPRELMAVSLRRPSRALPALLERWPNPLEASVRLRLRLDGRPGLPRQLKAYLLRSAAFLKKPLGGRRDAERKTMK